MKPTAAYPYSDFDQRPPFRSFWTSGTGIMRAFERFMDRMEREGMIQDSDGGFAGPGPRPDVEWQDTGKWDAPLEAKN